MKTRTVIIALVVTAVLSALAATAFTTFAAEATPTSSASTFTPPTREEMDARRAQMDEMLKKWDTLTAAQKEEIYALKDKMADIDSQIIDKYVEFGLIDKDTAAEMKERIAERHDDIRADGRMPIVGGGPGGGGRMGRGGPRGGFGGGFGGCTRP